MRETWVDTPKSMPLACGGRRGVAGVRADECITAHLGVVVSGYAAQHAWGDSGCEHDAVEAGQVAGSGL